MRRISAILAVSLLAVTGCSGGESEATATSSASASSSSTASPTTEAATTSPPTTTATTSPPSTSTTVAPQPPDGLTTLADAFGDLVAVEVVVTGTHRPRFDWTSNSDAARYMAVVSDDAGEVIWSWEGEGETVTVGSGEVDRDGLGGLLVRPGWLLVIGFDEAGDVVAVSDTIPVGA